MSLGEKLRSVVDEYHSILTEASDLHARRKPAPDKWSAKEILGHLIDSACNNHRRFVIAQQMDNLIFDGYDQEHWVKVQQYQSATWQDSINLWRLYNEHIARIIGLIPSDILDREHQTHNLSDVAWKTVPKTEPTTLHYFIDDYINHMDHHLKQIATLTQID